MSNIFKIIFHALAGIVIVSVPLLLKIHPAWLDMTLSGVATSLYVWAISTYATPATVGFAPKKRV